MSNELSAIFTFIKEIIAYAREEISNVPGALADIFWAVFAIIAIILLPVWIIPVYIMRLKRKKR